VGRLDRSISSKKKSHSGGFAQKPGSSPRPAYGLPPRGLLRGPFSPFRDAHGRFQRLRRGGSPRQIHFLKKKNRIRADSLKNLGPHRVRPMDCLSEGCLGVRSCPSETRMVVLSGASACAAFTTAASASSSWSRAIRGSASACLGRRGGGGRVECRDRREIS